VIAGSVDSSFDHADESAKKSSSSAGEKKKGGFRSLFGKK
jgi:hypothetical protein